MARIRYMIEDVDQAITESADQRGVGGNLRRSGSLAHDEAPRRAQRVCEDSLAGYAVVAPFGPGKESILWYHEATIALSRRSVLLSP